MCVHQAYMQEVEPEPPELTIWQELIEMLKELWSR